jgi:hypothetical protein
MRHTPLSLAGPSVWFCRQSGRLRRPPSSQQGISFSNGCFGPAPITSPMGSAFTVQNISHRAHDSHRVRSFTQFGEQRRHSCTLASAA